MTTMTAELEELLAAGAVLPLPTGDVTAPPKPGVTATGPTDGPGTATGPTDRPGTAAGGAAVPLTARTYRHPVLDDRPVVRLVAADLGTGEDATAEFLGLLRVDEPVTVGLGQRQSLGFPEWVLVHHPEDARDALAVVPELKRIVEQARSKPKLAVEAYHAVADRLARSKPHFLPTFYEQAGRVLLAGQEESFAGQLFNRARKAEAEHGLPVDPDRLDEVYLEFALAGALSATALAGYAKDLAARLPADEALDRFCGLCVRGVAAGLVPAATLATTVRRLVRAATKTGDPAVARERDYLTGLIGLPATLKATAWWKAQLPELVTLAGQDGSVRGTLLNLMPSDDWDGEILPQWLDILRRTGATDGLVDGRRPDAERPADGSVGWLRRFLAARQVQRYRRPRWLPALAELVTRMAAQLRAELAASGETIGRIDNVDLIDLLLTLEIPVADPGDGGLDLTGWDRGEGQHDLLGVAGDARFRAALFKAIPQPRDESSRQVIRLLAGLPGGRLVLTDWIRARSRECIGSGLPGLHEAVELLRAVPREALALAREEVSAAARTDVAAALVRTLRGGLFAELGWPAWEEALADLIDLGSNRREVVAADAWPYLIVAGPSRVRVIGDDIVLRHDLRIPNQDAWGEPAFHYVDGTLLVYWESRELNGRLRGYWHSAAGDPQPLEGTHHGRYRYGYSIGRVTLPVPGGGRTTGAGVLHVGDTAIPKQVELIGDGTSYWVRTGDRNRQWTEYDPVTGTYGRPGPPGFLADALVNAPDGSRLKDHLSWLLPAPSDQVTPVGVPVDGRLGWRVLELPDGTARGEDLAGRRVTVPKGWPVAALTLPGDDRPRALLDGGKLVDPDGIVSTVANGGDQPAGAAPLPPQRYWHQLRARDPEGSTALRRIDRETAAALLKGTAEQLATERIERAVATRGSGGTAAAQFIRGTAGTRPTVGVTAAQPTGAGQPAAPVAARPDGVVSLVRSVLPQLSHDALVAGVAGVLRFAGAQQTALAKLAEQVRDLPVAQPVEVPVDGPTDQELYVALDGLGVPRQSTAVKATVQQLHVLRQAVDAPLPDPLPRLHLAGPALPNPALDWPDRVTDAAAVAYRAAIGITPEPDRETLLRLLTDLDGLGLVTATETAGWRQFVLHVEEPYLTGPDGKRLRGNWRGILPLAEGTFIACYDHRKASPATPGHLFLALYRDPSGAFEVPAPYTVRSETPLGDDRSAGWLGRFLTEYATHGPVPWLPDAADRFVELTGVTSTVAKLVLAGLPLADSDSPLPADTRKLLGIKATEVGYARRRLRELRAEVGRALVAALLPDDVGRLWTDGPDVAGAAELWNRTVGRRPAVPEQLLADADRAVQAGWRPEQALPALLDPAGTPELSTDLVWAVQGDHVAPVPSGGRGFGAETLVGAVATAAWAAHHTPVGDPIRAALPAALDAVRDRLANPDLLLSLGQYARLSTFRQVAGTPTETGTGWERYGALVMATADDQPVPAIRVALLDDTGSDPFLPALRGARQRMFPVEAALWLVRDPGFASLLADPGDPVAGTRDPDGTWWPQDPTRSVPDLVAEVAAGYNLGPDAAATYLMLLAMPEPTDRNVARWTGWRPARLKAARAELAGTDLVVSATRARAGRSLFLPCAWLQHGSPRLPDEQWKSVLFRIPGQPGAPFATDLPVQPVTTLYRRAWQRLRDGDVPRLEELQAPPRGRR
ncbi:hypothetical protein [Plantactinospora sonchi]|uniref:DNA-binding protein n=1 Tax=Plantactinospora sonchi TaxID=1544735 RepID=A0ABU7RN74_9ACTN